jgi:hypothetical protein
LHCSRNCGLSHDHDRTVGNLNYDVIVSHQLASSVSSSLMPPIPVMFPMR